MSSTVRSDIQREVIRYLERSAEPARISTIATELRGQARLKGVRDSEVRAVVQPMIVTGKLSYAPGLKIKLGHANR
jgi:hypothetical protein